MDVPQNIFPTKEEIERNRAVANQVIEYIKRSFGYEAELVGSIAKETYTHGKNDIDIFVLFPKTVSKGNVERIGLEIGKSVAKLLNGRPEKHYASHPYIRIDLGDKIIEIVPAYKTAPGEKIISAVDRTPHHTEYVKVNLKDPKEVIKLKWFMKQIGIYGAETQIHGFSGYLCELLVIEYGSFRRLVCGNHL